MEIINIEDRYLQTSNYCSRCSRLVLKSKYYSLDKELSQAFENYSGNIKTQKMLYECNHLIYDEGNFYCNICIQKMKYSFQEWINIFSNIWIEKATKKIDKIDSIYYGEFGNGIGSGIKVGENKYFGKIKYSETYNQELVSKNKDRLKSFYGSFSHNRFFYPSGWWDGNSKLNILKEIHTLRLLLDIKPQEFSFEGKKIETSKLGLGTLEYKDQNTTLQGIFLPSMRNGSMECDCLFGILNKETQYFIEYRDNKHIFTKFNVNNNGQVFIYLLTKLYTEIAKKMQNKFKLKILEKKNDISKSKA